MRENDNTNESNNRLVSNSNNLTNNIISNLTNNVTNNLIVQRENSNEYSNLGLNSAYTGNNLEVLSESAYMNRNFESHIDEMFDNLTYLITTEKYL
jgi:hypothetical protein